MSVAAGAGLYDLEMQTRDRILVVDDDATIRMVICEALGLDNYEIEQAACVGQAREKLQEQEFTLVISDVVMPGETGVELLRWARQNRLETPFIMMTGHAEVSSVAEALNLGAHHFLQKPFRPLMLIEAVHSIIRSFRLQKQNDILRQELANYNNRLRQEVVQAQVENQRLFFATLSALTNAIDVRDAYTCDHSAAVSRLAARLARELDLDIDTQHAARTAGQLHDIGKIAVPEHILLKPARLNEEEFRQIMEHPLHGERILQPLPDFEEILPGVRNHHERYDGRGYPDRLRGEQIPLVARIVCVCDTWSAMRTNRPYRPQMSYDAALAVISSERGGQFDPDIAEAFLRLSKKVDLDALAERGG